MDISMDMLRAAYDGSAKRRKEMRGYNLLISYYEDALMCDKTKKDLNDLESNISTCNNDEGDIKKLQAAKEKLERYEIERWTKLTALKAFEYIVLMEKGDLQCAERLMMDGYMGNFSLHSSIKIADLPENCRKYGLNRFTEE